jgi:sugar phosphate isomerase/epimerase
LRCIGGFEGGVQVVGGEEKAANLDAIVENARLLSELGENSTLVGGCDCNVSLHELPDAVETLAKVFGNTALEIEPLGVTLAIEFNWGPIKSLPLAAEIARRSDRLISAFFSIRLIIIARPPNLKTSTRRSVPFIKHVHVDDMNGKPAELSNCNSDRALPGAGVLDLPAIFGAIEQHGYNGYFSIEMFSDELWALPASEAAQQMYGSLLPLCDD